MIKVRSKDQEKPGAPCFPELISSFCQKLESIKEELYYNWSRKLKTEENHDWLKYMFMYEMSGEVLKKSINQGL